MQEKEGSEEMKVAICAGKNFLLINFWKLMFWMGIKYKNSPYRFDVVLSVDPHPNYGWKLNKQGILEKDCPDLSLLRRVKK